jgi:hypothetical protein
MTTNGSAPCRFNSRNTANALKAAMPPLTAKITFLPLSAVATHIHSPMG